MLPTEPQFARSDVLRIFNHAQTYLFLGGAISTVGLLAATFSLLRRRLEPLLLWFALFAILYGLRLGMNYQMLWALGLRPQGFQRALVALSFLIPIPAFFFFRTLNLLGQVRWLVMVIFLPVTFCLAILTLLVGNRASFHVVNNTVVVAALSVVVVNLVRLGPSTPDVTLMRRGLLLFIAGAIYDNVTGMLGHYDNVEPFTFVFLLASLGIVAGRRALANEQQLTVIQKELEIAQRIQLSILPPALPTTGTFQLTARYLPMTSVAGDFYDILVSTDRELGLLIADVSGHGVPAALIASMVKLAAVAQRPNADRPSELLLGMNTTLCGNTQNQFVTAAYLYLNSATRELRYAAAGHPPMLLLRRGTTTELTENGLILAAFAFSTYSCLTCAIEPGDRFILYTDGLLEASNQQNEEFGRHRLQALVRETGHLHPTEAAGQIVAAIQQWSATQSDDLTLLLCDYTA